MTPRRWFASVEACWATAPGGLFATPGKANREIVMTEGNNQRAAVIGGGTMGADIAAIKDGTEKLMNVSQTFAQQLYERAAAEQAAAGGSATGGDDEVVDAEIVDDGN